MALGDLPEPSVDGSQHHLATCWHCNGHGHPQGRHRHRRWWLSRQKHLGPGKKPTGVDGQGRFCDMYMPRIMQLDGKIMVNTACKNI